MFAEWIPNALARVEQLSRLARPPGLAAIETARSELVNQPGGRPMPEIKTWHKGGGTGIEIRWPDEGMAISPEGELVIHSR
jgi:hypothetical protein